MKSTVIPVMYQAVIRHGFLEGKEYCKYCSYCEYHSRIERARCIITGEILPYYDTMMGTKCPFELKEEKTNGNNS